MIKGGQDPEALAELARGRLRAKLPDLRLALRGRMEAHHQFLLERILAHTDFEAPDVFPKQKATSKTSNVLS